MKLEPGEEICPECKGKKLVKGYTDEKIKLVGCPSCLGEGKMDWIDAIKGKKDFPQRYDDEHPIYPNHCWESILKFRQNYLKHFT